MEHFFRQIVNQRTKEELNELQVEMVVEKQDEEEEEEVKHFLWVKKKDSLEFSTSAVDAGGDTLGRPPHLQEALSAEQSPSFVAESYQ